MRLAFPFLPLALLVSAEACGSTTSAAPPADAGTTDGDASRASAWSSVLSGDIFYSAVWGSSADDVYVAGGQDGLIAHSTDHGATWSTQNLVNGADTLLQIGAIWGSGATDVYAAGGQSPRAAYPHVRLLHSSDRGASWQPLSTPDAPGLYTSLWGSSANDVYVIGNTNVLHSTDRGLTWSSFDAGFELEGVWGSGADDVYVVGGAVSSGADAGNADASDTDAGTLREGRVLHSSDHGATWQPVAKASTGFLLAVAGTPDGTRVVAVGEGGTILASSDHGATWSLTIGVPRVDADPKYFLKSVWFSPAGNGPYIGGSFGVGQQVAVEEDDPTGSILFSFYADALPGSEPPWVNAVWGTSDGDIYAAGLRLWHL
jgi:photosystem II stability/assembly factor-like uncharacterized protein